MALVATEHALLQLSPLFAKYTDGKLSGVKYREMTALLVKAVQDLKAGKIEFRVDKGANVHAPVGKASFPEDKLLDNARTFIRELLRAKPSAAKGQYVRSLTMSATMGPGIALDTAAIAAEVGH